MIFRRSRTLEDAIKGDLKKQDNTHFMLVDGMSTLMTKQVKECQSLHFYVSGLKWNLLIQSHALNDHLSFYLEISDENPLCSGWEVKCGFKLSAVSRAHAGPDICIPLAMCLKEEQKTWGMLNFISHTVLKERFLVKDNSLFGVEITEVKPNFGVTNIPRCITEVKPNFGVTSMPRTITEVKPNFGVTSIPRTMGTGERTKLMEVDRNNSRFTWKITQFSSFISEHHSSYEFTVGPRRWKLLMYPKGHGKGKGNSLSLFLHATDYVTNGPKAKTLAVFKIRMLDQLKRNHFESELLSRWMSSDPDCLPLSFWGKDQYFPLEKLHKASNGFLVNDQIYIGVEFFVVSTTESL